MNVSTKQKERLKNLDNMLDGFDSIESHFNKKPLSTGKKITISILFIIVLLLKCLWKPIITLFGKGFKPYRNMDKVSSLKLKAIGTKRNNGNNDNFLNQEEVAKFEKSGIHGPFKVLEKAEANEVLNHILNEHENNAFANKCPLGNQFVDALGNNPSINFVSLYAAQYNKKINEVLSNNIISNKLESLLGENVKCWRSQIFQKLQGAVGTFWHQSGTFRESSKKQKLNAPVNFPLGMNSLTTWVALTPSKIENGCLRILEGSHKNGFFEQFSKNILDNKLGYLMSLPNSKIRLALKTILYTSGSLLKVQMIFQEFMKYYPDYLDNLDPISIILEPGEAIIFSTLNTHCSFTNNSNEMRLGLVGRYCSSKVKVYDNFPEDSITTPNGSITFPTSNLKTFVI